MIGQLQVGAKLSAFVLSISILCSCADKMVRPTDVGSMAVPTINSGILDGFVGTADPGKSGFEVGNFKREAVANKGKTHTGSYRAHSSGSSVRGTTRMVETASLPFLVGQPEGRSRIISLYEAALATREGLTRLLTIESAERTLTREPSEIAEFAERPSSAVVPDDAADLRRGMLPASWLDHTKPPIRIHLHLSSEPTGARLVVAGSPTPFLTISDVFMLPDDYRDATLELAGYSPCRVNDYLSPISLQPGEKQAFNVRCNMHPIAKAAPMPHAAITRRPR